MSFAKIATEFSKNSSKPTYRWKETTGRKAACPAALSYEETAGDVYSSHANYSRVNPMKVALILGGVLLMIMFWKQILTMILGMIFLWVIAVFMGCLSW